MNATAFVLPGLNSLLNPKSRLRFLEVPEVQNRFRMAEAFFDRQLGQKIDFDSFFRSTTGRIYSKEWIHVAAAGIVSLQVGVSDLLVKKIGKPAWVVGCSLGDLARTVIAESCTFEAALALPLSAPQNQPGMEQIGLNVAVLTHHERPFSQGDVSEITALDIDVSQLSPTLLNVSGRFEDLERLRGIAPSRKWKVVPLIGYPVHSRHLGRYKEHFIRQTSGVSFDAPRSSTRVYSTLLKKEIESKEELRFEMENNLVLPHHWHESIEELVHRHEIGTFINLGPCQTLSKLIQKFPADVQTFEPEDFS